jgi:hypothetical protein
MDGLSDEIRLWVLEACWPIEKWLTFFSSDYCGDADVLDYGYMVWISINFGILALSPLIFFALKPTLFHWWKGSHPTILL